LELIYDGYSKKCPRKKYSQGMIHQKKYKLNKKRVRRGTYGHLE